MIDSKEDSLTYEVKRVSSKDLKLVYEPKFGIFLKFNLLEQNTDEQNGERYWLNYSYVTK